MEKKYEGVVAGAGSVKKAKYLDTAKTVSYTHLDVYKRQVF